MKTFHLLIACAAHYSDEAMGRFDRSAYSAEERHAYSLAYALEKAETGIRLLILRPRH